jgi:homeobox protein cut-like
MHRSRAEAAEEECARSAISLQQLQEESSRWSEMLEARKRLYEDTVNELQSRLQQRDAAIQAARKELNERPMHSDIAVLRKQLSILQSLHFNSNNDDDQEVEGGSGSGDVRDASNSTLKESSSSSSSSVEAGGSSGGTGELLDVTTIMLARVRKLESKVVRAESAKVDAESLCANLRDELEAARVEIEEQRELILRLEDGLASSTKSVSNGLKLVSKEPLKSSDEIEDVTMSAHKSQLDAVLSFSSPSKFSMSSTQSPRGDTVLSLGFASPYHSADSSSEHLPPAAVSVAEVLRAQRDRLNTRVLELEADAQARIAEVSTCHTSINKLTNDNVKLYEKVRYLQSIVRSMTGDIRIEVGEKGSSSSSRAGITQRSSALSSSSALVNEEDFEIRYKDLYNASLDPFERFAAQQRQQKFLSLSRADRFALSSGKLILGSKVARSFAVGYAIMLHLLVAVTLWHFSTARHFEGEAGCSKSVAGGAPLGLEIRS